MIDRIFSIAHLADQAVLILLLVLTAIAVFLIVERFIFLQKLKKKSLILKNEMFMAIHSQNYSFVVQIAQRQNHFVEKSLSVALEHLNKFGSQALPELFRSLQLEEKPKLEKSLGFLATVGSNAPYIGLFGTVLG
ncbi:MAG: MotA/TolQ/ExbB proton channel family protein, partial [Bdellovibrionales bacterium]